MGGGWEKGTIARALPFTDIRGDGVHGRASCKEAEGMAVAKGAHLHELQLNEWYNK